MPQRTRRRGRSWPAAWFGYGGTFTCTKTLWHEGHPTGKQHAQNNVGIHSPGAGVHRQSSATCSDDQAGLLRRVVAGTGSGGKKESKHVKFLAFTQNVEQVLGMPRLHLDMPPKVPVARGKQR
jgi:hypothetical protein